MKKALAFLLAVMLCLGCASAVAEKYVIATDTTFAPFEFEDDSGNFVGIDMDLLAARNAGNRVFYKVK